jgi:hypothetical protein
MIRGEQDCRRIGCSSLIDIVMTSAMALLEVRTLSVSIDRDWREVYSLASVPQNFARWASGLGTGLERSGEGWIAQGPEGPIRIRFSPPNDFGVLDHVVTLASGAEISVPMRVLANGSGSEVSLTLFRQPGMDDEKFAADAEWVRRDLASLKRWLEGQADSAPD